MLEEMAAKSGGGVTLREVFLGWRLATLTSQRDSARNVQNEAEGYMTATQSTAVRARACVCV